MNNVNQDACAQPSLLNVADALARMRQAITPITETEIISLSNALDRVLAESIFSHINVPPCDNSAMDGYALRYEDSNQARRIIGESRAGHPFSGEISSGECVRIMTGAAVPVGANAVVMQEQITRVGNEIQLNATPTLGENIRRSGEDIAQGSLVLAQGHRITPIDIGLLASLGCAQVNVYRRLRVAVMSTGDELTPIHEELSNGQIYDSNRHTLIALLRRIDAAVIDMSLLPDNFDAIRAAVQQAMLNADVIISSGGVSVGDADYTKDVFAELGQIDFWKVAMKPGKPFAFGFLPKINAKNPTYFFGLPGNPVSAVVTYHQLVLPNLRLLAGEVFSSEPMLPAVALENIKKQPGRADYQRGIFKVTDGINGVISAGSQSSGVLTSMAKANCYILIEKNRGSVIAGETVQIIPFDKFIR